MKTMILFTIAFLVLLYVYTFLKIRQKRKNNSTSAIKEFNERYLTKRNNKITETNNSLNKNYKKYITKYNSKVDYFTKDEL